MIRLLIALILCGIPQVAFSQAVWKGKTYSGRLCSNPNCRMCASIDAQLSRQRQRMIESTVQTPVRSGGSYRAVTKYRQVKRCNGRVCWYESVPYTVMEWVPDLVETEPEVKVDLLTNLTLEPTPQPVVEAMLRLAGVKEGEKVFDLGCGDGRIVHTAVKRFGASGVGVDLNEDSLKAARRIAEVIGTDSQSVFIKADVRGFDASAADVVCMYLYPDLMAEVVKGLRPGQRIVSHAHEIPGVDNERHALLIGGKNYLIFTGMKR